MSYKLPLALVLVAFSIGTADAKNRTHVQPTWNNGLSIHTSDGSYVYVAPEPSNEAERSTPSRLHCSTTGKTTTCGRW